MKFLIFSLLIIFALCDDPQKFNLQSALDGFFIAADSKTSQPSFDLLKTTNRDCVKEKLGLTKDNPHVSFEGATVAIYSASFICKPDLNDYLDKLFNETLKTLKNDANTFNLECFKLVVLKLDPKSRLIQGFEENLVAIADCEKIAYDSRGEALKGFSAAFGGFHETTYGTDGNENEAIMYKLILLANGDYSEEIINFAKSHYKKDFVKKSHTRIGKILRGEE